MSRSREVLRWMLFLGGGLLCYGVFAVYAAVLLLYFGLFWLLFGWTFLPTALLAVLMTVLMVGNLVWSVGWGFGLINLAVFFWAGTILFLSELKRAEARAF